MKTYDDALAAIKRYEDEHRHPGRQRFDISLPFDLFPQAGPPCLKCDQVWPATYPHVSRAGVYLIFDDQARLLYVGKASMGNDIGSRLGSHFGYAVDRATCNARGNWTNKPRFVVTVATPIDSIFEAPSLEEFLIDRLQPMENQRGKLISPGGL
jgi:hypothetical protein